MQEGIESRWNFSFTIWKPLLRHTGLWNDQCNHAICWTSDAPISQSSAYSWWMGLDNSTPQNRSLNEELLATPFSEVKTKWLNQEAMRMMISFGKKQIVNEKPRINSLKNPILFNYYNKGNWQLWEESGSFLEILICYF